ncbi:MAG: glycosyltransferase family 39 protein [Deltaproteobacteria bacterium]|nr:glycosyltransferase family 39 protein [Deltaproteobacteria bacterium]
MYMPVLDEKYYVGLGKIIAGGQLIGENRVFFMDPLYGYFLGAAFFFCGDNLTAVRLVQIVMDASNVVPIYFIGTRLWNREAGFVAALSYAVYPVAFFYSLLMLKTTLCISMLLFFMLYMIYALEQKGGLRWYCLGFFAALLSYLRGNMLLLVPLIILFMPIYQRMGWRDFAKRSFLLILGFISLLTAGVFRNFYVSGEFAVLNSQTGRLLYSCNNPENLTGRYNVPNFARPDPVASEIDFQKEAERRKGALLDSGAVSRYWTMETFRFFLKNPATLPRLLYNKIRGTVGYCEIANNHSFHMASLFSPLLKWPSAPFALAFAFGLPGLMLGIRKDRRVAMLLVPLLAIFITILIFYTSSRFRMPAVPFLLMGAGITFSFLHELIKKRKIAKALTLVLVIGICGFFSLSVACPKPNGTEEFLIAKAYWRQKDYENAKYFALKGANAFPAQSRFHVLLGMIAFSENHLNQAIGHNRDAIRLDRKSVDALHNMGLVYLETKKPEQAILWFQKALVLEKRPDIFFHLAMAWEERGDMETAAENYQKYLDTTTSAAPLRDLAKRRLSLLGSRDSQNTPNLLAD